MGEDAAERARPALTRTRRRDRRESQGARRARVAKRRQGDLLRQGRGRRRGRELPLLRVCGRHDRRPEQPDGGSLLTYSLKEPIGVCAQIVPWNYPLLMAVWKLSPALISSGIPAST